jgi:hypothetical protein
MYCIKLDDRIVYACTDYCRFVHEAVKYGQVGNATIGMTDGAVIKWREAA